MECLIYRKFHSKMAAVLVLLHSFSHIQSQETSFTPLLSVPNLKNTPMEYWVSCTGDICEGESINCAALIGCECNKNLINCSLEEFSAVFERPNVLQTTRTVRGVQVLRGNFETISNFVAKLFEGVNALRRLSVSDFCVENSSGASEKSEKYSSFVNLTHLSSEFPELRELSIESNCLVNIFGEFVVFSGLRVLSLSNNSIKDFPTDLMRRLLHLEVFNISWNRLANVSESALESQTTLKSLDFSHNRLRVLPERIFKYTRSLRFLDLNGNLLSVLSNTLFASLENLQKLMLSGNRIIYVPASCFQNLKNLHKLDLSNNRITSLSSNWLTGLKSIVSINLDRNSVKIVEPNFLSVVPTIKILNLNNNQLTALPSTGLHIPESPIYLFANNNITHLDLLLTRFTGRCEILDLSNNCITSAKLVSVNYIQNDIITTFRCVNCCLTGLHPNLLQTVKFADFRHNHISSLTLQDLIDLHLHLRKLDLSFNLIQTIDATDIAQKGLTSNLQFKIILDHNPVDCDCSLVSFVQYLKQQSLMESGGEMFSRIFFLTDNLLCASPKRLQNVSVDTLNTKELLCDFRSEDGCLIPCKCFYRSDDSLIVHCSNRNLSHFPNLDKRMLRYSQVELFLKNNSISWIPVIPESHWANISKLHMSHNKLSSLNNLVVRSKLKSLFVDYNNLTRVEEPLKYLSLSSNREVKLRLQNNPWICGCDLLSLKSRQYSRTILDYTNVACQHKSSSKRVFLSNSSDEEICLYSSPQKQELAMIAIPCVVILIIIVTSSYVLFSRYKLQTKLWLYTHGFCLKYVSEEEIDANKIFDAFVSYSSKDEKWVVETLLPGLENGTSPYSLCLHERDWLAGEWIPNQIVKSVQLSRRTILVLTQNFIDSYWSKFEFQVAYSQMLSDNINRTIIVVPEELPSLDQLEEHLSAFVSMQGYIRWQNPNFWRKLHRLMPRVINKTQSETEIGETQISSV